MLCRLPTVRGELLLAHGDLGELVLQLCLLEARAQLKLLTLAASGEQSALDRLPCLALDCLLCLCLPCLPCLAFDCLLCLCLPCGHGVGSRSVGSRGECLHRQRRWRVKGSRRRSLVLLGGSRCHGKVNSRRRRREASNGALHFGQLCRERTLMGSCSAQSDLLLRAAREQLLLFPQHAMKQSAVLEELVAHSRCLRRLRGGGLGGSLLVPLHVGCERVENFARAPCVCAGRRRRVVDEYLHEGRRPVARAGARSHPIHALSLDEFVVSAHARPCITTPHIPR